jgi:hypothetical protein
MSTYYEAPYCVTSSILLLKYLSFVQIFFLVKLFLVSYNCIMNNRHSPIILVENVSSTKLIAFPSILFFKASFLNLCAFSK